MNNKKCKVFNSIMAPFFVGSIYSTALLFMSWLISFATMVLLEMSIGLEFDSSSSIIRTVVIMVLLYIFFLYKLWNKCLRKIIISQSHLSISYPFKKTELIKWEDIVEFGRVLCRDNNKLGYGTNAVANDVLDHIVNFSDFFNIGRKRFEYYITCRNSDERYFLHNNHAKNNEILTNIIIEKAFNASVLFVS